MSFHTFPGKIVVLLYCLTILLVLLLQTDQVQKVAAQIEVCPLGYGHVSTFRGDAAGQAVQGYLFIITNKKLVSHMPHSI